jgi:hypothetical protein
MTDKQERRSVKRIDCYNRTIFNDEIEHSLVVDINNEGAGLLLLKEQSLFKDDKKESRPVISGNVHLTIFHPDMPIQEGVSINAEVIWVNYDYSSDHHKIGVRFFDMENAEIEMLAKWLSKEGNYYFHCELEKR